MKWRCPQCGKPQERNDPPCDNCGHHTFERAVVPQATAEADHEQFVWACTECGRQHQKHSPPCSRCGAATLEKRPLDYGDIDPGETPSYFELAGRFEIAAALVVALIVTIGVLGFVGILDVPGLTPEGQPTVEDVPGDADTIGAVSLDDVETEIIDSFDEGRSESLDRGSGLDAMATFLNRDFVKNTTTGAESVVTRKKLRQFETSCRRDIVFQRALTFEVIGSDATAESIASTLQPQLEGNSMRVTSPEVNRIGLDVHAGPNERVYATIAYC